MRKRISVLMLVVFLLQWMPLPAKARTELLQSGDRILLWAEGYDVALSAQGEGNYLAGVSVAVYDGVPQGFGETEIWTATENADGSWCFENGGAFLSLGESSLQLTLDGAYRNWDITDMEEGTCRISERENGRYLTWYSGREVYGAETTLRNQNILRLYVLPADPEETEPDTEPTEAPTEETEPPTEEPPEETLDTEGWQLYFGLLHSHTADSDGFGSVSEAFAQAKAREGMDFFAVTDHSDAYDNDREGTLTADGSQISTEWAAGKAAAASATDETFVAISGFEISWNQGQGHISTFNTPGWLSRDREGFRLYREGLENYYEALLEVPESISQFNHPGTVYGDFKNFAYPSPQVDALVTLIEVGCGAGAEYRRYYDAYVTALDRGWHLAPTNNQNEHTGVFGQNSNRTAVLTTELTESAIFDALRNYRVYATEDADLQIYYTLNGQVMGSQLLAAGLGETVSLSVMLLDPTDTQWGRVDVITEGGAVAASAEAARELTFTLPTTANYYFLRVTQPDGDMAVTAPVWLRQQADMGISRMGMEDPLLRAGEEQTVLVELYNNEKSPMTVSSLVLKDGDGNILASLEEPTTLARFETGEIPLVCCFREDGVYLLKAEAEVSLDGEIYLLTEELEITVLPQALVGQVLIDGTHGADETCEAFGQLAADRQISVCVETLSITQSQLEACRLLVIPNPVAELEPEFMDLVKDYVEAGGNVLLMGEAGGSEILNCLLGHIGSTMKLNEDKAEDPVNNGGEPEQLFTAEINDSTWTEGILEGQIFAHVNGCTVDPGQGIWLVKSMSHQVLLAAEGNVILAGSNFLADVWLDLPGDPWALPYANRTICENLLGITRSEPVLTPIATVRAGKLGGIYRIEGLVTSGTHNRNTTFPDTIYLQDATGGIAVVGYGEPGLELGRRVRVIGALEISEGNPCLRLLDVEVFEKQTPISPAAARYPLDYAQQGGTLLKLEGWVQSLEAEEEAVHSFLLKDENGASVTVWVEDTTLSGSLGRNELARKVVQPGNKVSAVGICHLRAGEAVLRIRDCDEVQLLWTPEETLPATEPGEALREETNGNPATGDTAFPAWSVPGMLWALILLTPNFRKKRK